MIAARSPEGLIAFFAVVAAMGLVLAFTRISAHGRAPVLGLLITALFGGLGGFFAWTLREDIERAELIVWLIGGAVFLTVVVGIAARAQRRT